MKKKNLTDEQLNLFEEDKKSSSNKNPGKNSFYSLKISLSILLIIFSLFAYSFFSVSFSIKNVDIEFIAFEDLVDFSDKKTNEDVDSLLSSYLANTNNEFFIDRSPLSLIEPKRKNAFLINPILENGETALDKFFAALVNEKDSTLVRIAHYGDSQLEGDRVTSVFRQKFQERFGGYGPGFTPLSDITGSTSYYRNSSGNWNRYTVFHNRYRSSFYGLSGTVFRFTNCVTVTPDSIEENGVMVAVNDSSDVEGEIVCYDHATVKYKIRSSYDQLRLMYGNNSETCYLNCYNGATGEIISQDSLLPTQEMKIHKIKMSSPVLNVKLQFTSNNSPEFYGLFFDSYNGVQVDNYAIRGHSGDGLMLINPEFLAQQIKALNVKLIIFQFGANVVPYIKNEKSCQMLKTVYSDLFARFKQAAPNTSVLVIGAGDMARHVEGGYASYQMLPRIRDIQREAALENGCAFFDLFGMMGGINSIMTWSQKRLASNDGHLSPKGQEILGNELFSGLMVEYNMYLYKNKKKK